MQIAVLVALALAPFASVSKAALLRQDENGCATTPRPSVELRSGALAHNTTRKVVPVYPPEALARRMAGTVRVRLFVDRTGGVECAEALSGHTLLQGAATEAARKWTLLPVLLEGMPVPYSGVVTFQFSLARSPTRGQVTVHFRAPTSPARRTSG
jgi:TonB family protein